MEVQTVTYIRRKLTNIVNTYNTKFYFKYIKFRKDYNIFRKISLDFIVDSYFYNIKQIKY